MRRWHPWAFAGLLLFFLTSGASAERQIALKDLPAVVRASVQREIAGSTLKRLVKEAEDGKTFYEAETVRADLGRDLLFDATGQLVEVEERIAIDAAPAAVRAALDARGRILRIERATKGSRITYEALVQKNGKKSEVTVDERGTPVKR